MLVSLPASHAHLLMEARCRRAFTFGICFCGVWAAVVKGQFENRLSGLFSFSNVQQSAVSFFCDENCNFMLRLYVNYIERRAGNCTVWNRFINITSKTFTVTCTPSLMITIRQKTWYKKPFTGRTCTLRIGRMNESSHGYFALPITLMWIISARQAAASSRMPPFSLGWSTGIRRRSPCSSKKSNEKLDGC